MQIDIGLERVEKILHVADIHIRNFKRHKEYRQVFRKLYKDAKQLPKNSLIYVAGDIVHTKTDISPELIELTSEFLRKLADIRPTIVITGNHDANLNNSSRLDALTPIIDNLNHPNLHYLKDSGIYRVCDIDFIVMSVFNDPKDFPDATKATGIKIGLHHGPVHNSVTDIGYVVNNESLKQSVFTGCDLVMLGDIHKRQYLNENKTVAYAGSLIQQNFGETFENHGYMLWDMETRTADFVDIANDYGYYTIEMVDGILPNIDNIPKYPRLRIKTTNTSQAEVKQAIVEVRKKSKVQDIIVIKTDRLANISNNSKSAIEITKDIRDPNYQNELIVDYLERNYDLDSELLNRIRKINRSLNSLLPDVEISRNVSWKPKIFTFSNMFSYGEDNKINFQNMNGTVGIFAPNHAGKSAILDALAYCLFDKCSRTKSASEVMNTTKSDFICTFNFEIDGIDYFIERKAKKSHTGHVRVDVDFWMIDEAGEKVSLNGEQRVYTNRNIRGYLGYYEDFVLTALSLQNNNTGFIDKSQVEKKDLLAQFLDITVFEELYRVANEEIKEVEVLLKQFKDFDFSTQLIDSEEKLKDYQIEYSELEKIKDSIETNRKKLNESILNQNSNLIKLDSIGDIKDLAVEKQSIESAITDAEARLDKYNTYYSTNTPRLRQLTQLEKKFNLDDITDRVNKLTLSRNEQSKIKAELNTLKIKVNHKLDKLKAIGQFDPNCDFCKSTPFVQSAFKVEQELTDDKISVNRLLERQAKVDSLIVILEPVELEHQELRRLDIEHVKLSSYQAEIKLKRVQRKSELREKNRTLVAIDKQIEKYYQNEENIRSNATTQKKIDLLNIQLDDVLEEQSTTTNNLQQAFSNISVATKTIESITSSIEQAHDLEEKYKAYEYYLNSIQRNGVPYELVSNILPYIQEEVNTILSQIVDFTIEFDVDGKNINTQICYGDSKRWPLELTSGMEKFISSLAIRVGLINVSNLPRPNFLAIDEGFGNLDTNNLNSIFMLFDYLKTEFEYIVVISHIDLMRDVTDNLLEISKEQGLSKVLYN
tara:strand:+ start:7595 stop:10735 length:3141 start_codon:yes stop_codon:yes gene_type:complete